MTSNIFCLYAFLLFVLSYVSFASLYFIYLENLAEQQHTLLLSDINIFKEHIRTIDKSNFAFPSKFLDHKSLTTVFLPSNNNNNNNDNNNNNNNNNNSDIPPLLFVNVALHKFPNGSILALSRTAELETDPPLYGMKGTYTVAKIWSVLLDENLTAVPRGGVGGDRDGNRYKYNNSTGSSSSSSSSSSSRTILPLPHYDAVLIKHSLVEDLHLGPEDPRFFIGPRGRLYISYGGNSRHPLRERVMWIAPLDNVMEGIEVIVPFSKPTRQEKNWIFWTHSNEIYASYSIRPHVVLKVDDNTGETQVVYNTSMSMMMGIYEPFNTLGTKYHLGTPTIRIQDVNGDYYHLAIFHTKWEGPPGAYKHYVYTFADHPPFHIQSASQIEFSLPCTLGHEVVFIASLELLGPQQLGEDQQVMLGYGVDDQELHYALTTLHFLQKDLLSCGLFSSCN